MPRRKRDRKRRGELTLEWSLLLRSAQPRCFRVVPPITISFRVRGARACRFANRARLIGDGPPESAWGHLSSAWRAVRSARTPGGSPATKAVATRSRRHANRQIAAAEARQTNPALPGVPNEEGALRLPLITPSRLSRSGARRSPNGGGEASPRGLPKTVYVVEGPLPLDANPASGLATPA